MKRHHIIPVLILATIGSAIVAQPPDDRPATFFVGRVKYGKNQGRDCGDVGKNMVQIVSRVTTIPVREEKKLNLTDPAVFETPFLFMNGHHDFVFTERELEILGTYFEHGGFLFASGCCTNPPFPRAWRRELARVFPGETVHPLPYEHPIYRTFYRIERVRNLHENKPVYLEALFYEGRMVAVMCENGLCCAFTMNNSCNVGRGVSPEDGKQLALNISIYAMTH